MCRLSFINVVCEILKSICGLYKYMLCLSHGKAKEKRKKRKKEGAFPECLSSATEENIKIKNEGVFRECAGIWHTGKDK
jgi:hypothetical protein